MGVKTILDVTVKDVEKRRFPTKHYVSARAWEGGRESTLCKMNRLSVYSTTMAVYVVT